MCCRCGTADEGGDVDRGAGRDRHRSCHPGVEQFWTAICTRRHGRYLGNRPLPDDAFVRRTCAGCSSSAARCTNCRYWPARSVAISHAITSTTCRSTRSNERCRRAGFLTHHASAIRVGRIHLFIGVFVPRAIHVLTGNGNSISRRCWLAARVSVTTGPGPQDLLRSPTCAPSTSSPCSCHRSSSSTHQTRQAGVLGSLMSNVGFGG